MKTMQMRAFLEAEREVCPVTNLNYPSGLVEVVVRDEVACGRYETVAMEAVVLMRSSGLLDRHGKTIFEGDLVRLPGTDKAVEVVFEKGAFGYLANGEFTTFAHNDGIVFTDEQVEAIEVVGNVYESRGSTGNEK